MPVSLAPGASGGSHVRQVVLECGDGLAGRPTAFMQCDGATTAGRGDFLQVGDHLGLAADPPTGALSGRWS